MTGRGFVTLDSARAFDVTADAAHFDPSRFGAFPAGSLDGKITTRGRLASPWNVEGDIALAQGSRLEGVAVSGHLHADASPTAIHGVAADAAVASATIAVTGAAGTAGDKLAFKVDAPRLEDLRGVLAHHAGAAIPEAIGGALHVRGTLTSDPGGNGLDVDVRGDALQWGKLLRVGTLEARTGIAPGGLTLDPAANATRGIALKLAATRVSAPQGELATLTIDGAGTPRTTRPPSHSMARASTRTRASPVDSRIRARLRWRGQARSTRSKVAARTHCNSMHPQRSSGRAITCASAAPDCTSPKASPASRNFAWGPGKDNDARRIRASPLMR